MKRRQFLQHTLVTGAAATLTMSRSLSSSASVQWPVGCFNRPWTTWSYDEALKQIKAAGYRTTGLLTRTKDEPFIGADATPEYLAKLKQRIAASGLTATMGALRTRHNIPLADSIKDPIEELKPIARRVTGFCAKDCGAPNGDVMIQFGAGKVNFAGVFGVLKAAGFAGPIMVECCKIGATAEETGMNARANRMFLEDILTRI